MEHEEIKNELLPKQGSLADAFLSDGTAFAPVILLQMKNAILTDSRQEINWRKLLVGEGKWDRLTVLHPQ